MRRDLGERANIFKYCVTILNDGFINHEQININDTMVVKNLMALFSSI